MHREGGELETLAIAPVALMKQLEKKHLVKSGCRDVGVELETRFGNGVEGVIRELQWSQRK